MDLHWLCPSPQAVEIGGRALLVSPLRIRDLARLETWRRSRILPDLAALRGADTDDDGVRRRIRDLIDRAEEQAEGELAGTLREVLSDHSGFSLLLGMATRDHAPALSPSELIDLAASAGLPARESLLAVAFSVDPVAEILGWIDGPPGPTPRGPTWGERYCSLVGDHPWLSLAAFGDLTLGQLRCLSSRGKYDPATPAGISLRDAQQLAEARGLFFDPNSLDAEGW